MESPTGVPICSFLSIVKVIAKILKNAYLIFAAVFLCYEFYNTIDKVRQQKISVNLGVEVVPKIKYPSITFCHKYKHGSKNALLTYNNQLFGKWKKSGNILLSINRFVTIVHMQ